MRRVQELLESEKAHWERETDQEKGTGPDARSKGNLQRHRVRAGETGKVTVGTQLYHGDSKIPANKTRGKKEESHVNGELGTRKDVSQ